MAASVALAILVRRNLTRAVAFAGIRTVAAN